MVLPLLIERNASRCFEPERLITLGHPCYKSDCDGDVCSTSASRRPRRAPMLRSVGWASRWKLRYTHLWWLISGQLIHSDPLRPQARGLSAYGTIERGLNTEPVLVTSRSDLRPFAAVCPLRRIASRATGDLCVSRNKTACGYQSCGRSCSKDCTSTFIPKRNPIPRIFHRTFCITITGSRSCVVIFLSA